MTGLTIIARAAGLAVLLTAAVPAHAQFDLLRSLVPRAGQGFDGQHVRRHGEEVAAIARLAGTGSLEEAVRRAELLVADERRLVADAPRSPLAGMLMDSAVMAAGLHERGGNSTRALELLQLALDAGGSFPGRVISQLDLYSGIAELQFRLRAFDASMRTWQTILAAHEHAPPFMQPLRARAYAGLGRAALEAGNDSVAETNLRLAIAHDPATTRAAPVSRTGATSFAEAQAAVRAAFGRAGELAASVAGQHAVTSPTGEFVTGEADTGRLTNDVLNVRSPHTDLARLYHRRGDATSLKRLYQLEFAGLAAGAESVDSGGMGPPALLEKQYARFGAWLAGMGESDLAEQAFGHALRLNARRLAITAAGTPPELLAGPFAARRQILDLILSLRLAQKHDARRWRGTVGDLLQSKGLKSNFLGRRARVIALSKDPQVRRLASIMDTPDAPDGPDRYASRMNTAVALQGLIGKSLAPLTFEDGGRFLDRVGQELQSETLVSVSSFTRFDFSSQQFTVPHYLGAMLRRGELTVVDLGPAAGIDALGARLRADLSRPPRPGSGGSTVPASARAAYNALLRPMLGAKNHAGNYVADLDGAVSLLPFEAMASDSGRYLIEDGSWRYLSSARSLLPDATPRPAAGQSVVLAAPAYDLPPVPAATAASTVGRSAGMAGRRFAPLPQALSEGSAVAWALRGSGAGVALYSGAQATTGVLAAVRSPRFLHIATHGFFMEEAGSRREQVTGNDGRQYVVESITTGRSSGLALAGANDAGTSGGATGVFYAAQLRQVDLAGTELAVLSACDTSLGSLRPDEGVDSLRQALEIAGARTMVTSLWSAPDAETGVMMADFYRALGTGASKPAALREAKLRLRQRQPHPFYWAPFVVTGMP